MKEDYTEVSNTEVSAHTFHCQLSALSQEAKDLRASSLALPITKSPVRWEECRKQRNSEGKVVGFFKQEG